MKCPECNEEFMPTLKEIAREIELIYPQSIFKSHPIAWVRRLLKFLSGMSYYVLVDEEKHTNWEIEKNATITE